MSNQRRLRKQLSEQAIQEALEGNWKNALLSNKQLLEAVPDNTDAMLRMGFALLQLNKLDEAKKAYVKALKLSPTNQIARNNLEKIKILQKKGTKGHNLKPKSSNQIDPALFLHVRGKTQALTLINIGQANVLAKLNVGEKVVLNIKKRRVEVRNEHSEYIGALPDDISKRLILFLKAGSEYVVYIKEASKNNVDVFIKEIKLGKKVGQFVSFPKNMQDDIKIMEETEDDDQEEDGGDGSSSKEKAHRTGDASHTSDSDEQEDEGTGEQPIDLEELAEEVEESDFYPGGSAGSSEEDDEE